MTIITKVEASYIDHMNDDVLEVNSFSPRMLPGSLSSPFLRREPGGEATRYLGNTIYQQSPLPLQSSISALFRLQSHSWSSSTLHGSYVARKYHRHPSFLVIYILEYMQLYTILLFYCLYSRSMCEQKHCEVMQIWWECLQHPQMQISMLFGSLVLIGNTTYSQCSYSGSTSYVSEWMLLPISNGFKQHFASWSCTN